MWRATAGRGFASDARSPTRPEADAIFEDIAAADGPFQDLAVGYDPSFARSEWTFSGRLDFSGGLAAFGDDALTAELDGEPLGQSAEEIEAQLGEPLADVIQARVAVRLPGEVTSNAPTAVGDAVVWQAGFGDDAIDLEATGAGAAHLDHRRRGRRRRLPRAPARLRRGAAHPAHGRWQPSEGSAPGR